MTRTRQKQRRPMYRPRNNMDYAVRGMVDMGRMAVGGAVVIGTIGAVGSVFKK